MFMGGMGILLAHYVEFEKPWWRPTYQGWIGFTLSSKMHIGAQNTSNLDHPKIHKVVHFKCIFTIATVRFEQFHQI
jgi:hypothetical protein